MHPPSLYLFIRNVVAFYLFMSVIYFFFCVMFTFFAEEQQNFIKFSRMYRRHRCMYPSFWLASCYWADSLILLIDNNLLLTKQRMLFIWINFVMHLQTFFSDLNLILFHYVFTTEIKLFLTDRIFLFWVVAIK